VRAGQAACGQRRHEEPEADEDRSLRERGEVLRLAVTVGMRAISRPDGHADGEEREQRRDEVGAGMDRLGDEPEAVRLEPGDELDGNQDARGDHRHERGPPLRRHASS
jgi:hypothetical protein